MKLNINESKNLMIRMGDLPKDNTLQQDLLFEMANLSQKKTGLPVIIWVRANSESGDGQHNSPRIKFQNNTATRCDSNSLIPISIDTDPKILIKNPTLNISSEQLELIRQWIIRNYETLISYWNGDYTTDELIDVLK